MPAGVRGLQSEHRRAARSGRAAHSWSTPRSPRRRVSRERARGSASRTRGWPARGPAAIRRSTRRRCRAAAALTGRRRLRLVGQVPRQERGRRAGAAYLPFRAACEVASRPSWTCGGAPRSSWPFRCAAISAVERRRARRRRPPAPDGRTASTPRGIDYPPPGRRSGDDVCGVVKAWALVDRDERGQAAVVTALTARPRVTARAGSRRRAGAGSGGGRDPPRAVGGRRHEYRRRWSSGGALQVRGTRLEVRNCNQAGQGMPAEVALATPMPARRLEGPRPFQVIPRAST